MNVQDTYTVSMGIFLIHDLTQEIQVHLSVTRAMTNRIDRSGKGTDDKQNYTSPKETTSEFDHYRHFPVLSSLLEDLLRVDSILVDGLIVGVHVHPHFQVVGFCVGTSIASQNWPRADQNTVFIKFVKNKFLKTKKIGF